ncbi:MAG: hypothetical protein ACKVKG_19155, partial [Alphaproteobacteria bacterium]
MRAATFDVGRLTTRGAFAITFGWAIFAGAGFGVVILGAVIRGAAIGGGVGMATAAFRTGVA